MVSIIIPLAIAFVLAMCVIFLFRKFSILVINAVTGLAILVIFNYFQITATLGGSEIPINLATVLICTFGGIPGAVIVIILALLGVTV